MPISEVTNEDCMNLMGRFPDKYFELAIVDPPYGIDVHSHETGGRGDGLKDLRDWDKITPSEHYFKELRRVSKEQIIWGANYFNCFSGNMGAIVWDKLQPLPDASQYEIASYSRLRKVASYKQRWTNFVNTKQTKHPTEKPIELYKWALKNYATKGDKILDTHLGSGSSRIAAYKLGFDFWGCELDKDYFEDQEKRFAKSIHEPLFQTAPTATPQQLFANNS